MAFAVGPPPPVAARAGGSALSGAPPRRKRRREPCSLPLWRDHRARRRPGIRSFRVFPGGGGSIPAGRARGPSSRCREIAVVPGMKGLEQARRPCQPLLPPLSSPSNERGHRCIAAKLVSAPVPVGWRKLLRPNSRRRLNNLDYSGAFLSPEHGNVDLGGVPRYSRSMTSPASSPSGSRWSLWARWLRRAGCPPGPRAASTARRRPPRRRPLL